jgi:hypothetical protein
VTLARRLAALGALALVATGCPREVPPTPEPAEPPLAETLPALSRPAALEIGSITQTASGHSRALRVAGRVRPSGVHVEVLG